MPRSSEGAVATRISRISYFSEDTADSRGHGIVGGVSLRFEDADVERAFLTSRFPESKGVLRSMSTVSSALIVVDLASQFIGSWDYDDLPLGFLVIVLSEVVVLMLALVPRLIATVGQGLSPSFLEAWLLITYDLGLLILNGFCNYHRVGVVLHQDGGHLWKVQGRDPTPSDVIFVSTFYLFSIYYNQLPMIRASRSWPHMLAMFGLYCALTFTPGLSPEPLSVAIAGAAFLGVYLSHLWVAKRDFELAERCAWHARRQLTLEAQRLRDAEVERLSSARASEQERVLQEILEELAAALESKSEPGIAASRKRLSEHGWTPQRIDAEVAAIRRRQSEERGVRLSFLLSDEFLEQARLASGASDPSFSDLQEPFFLGKDALGRETICPRDGKPGCALVDFLPQEHVAPCTHFMSWTWSSRLSTLRSALGRWAEKEALDPKEVTFYMCFFVNNQYRILVPDAQKKGSDNLGSIFEASLTRTTKMVAVLDGFVRPVYLTRIWTIFEQFVAHKLGIPVAIAMPAESGAALIREFERGVDGIMHVRDSMSCVDSSSAKASDPNDEEAVKSAIRASIGFSTVDSAIKSVMSAWVAAELRGHMDTIMAAGHEPACKTGTPGSSGEVHVSA